MRDTVWFGTTFYDGEGTTGVGAVGSFSFATARFDLRYPPDLADWSTSALVVDGAVLWLGLINHPEGADRWGGVLRYDYRSRATNHYPLPEIVNALVVWNGMLYAGTMDGIFYVQDGRFIPLSIGFDPSGRITLLEDPDRTPRRSTEELDP